MTLYGFGLFVHIVAAILLVGGSAYAHLSTSLIARARTVDGVRSHVGWLHAFVKASGPMAGVVLLAGLYLTFAGGWWGTGWPVVSLVLFLGIGAAAPTMIEPTVTRMKRRLDDEPDGPLTAELAAELQDRRLVFLSWLFAGADGALVFLMTNKPGYLGSLVVAVLGLAVGAAFGVRAVRRGEAVPATASPVTPPSVPPAAPAS